MVSVRHPFRAYMSSQPRSFSAVCMAVVQKHGAYKINWCQEGHVKMDKFILYRSSYSTTAFLNM